MLKIFTFFIIFSIILSLFSCYDCREYKDEIYEDVDTQEIKELRTYLDSLNLWFTEPAINEVDYESYRFTHVSILGWGYLCRLENKDSQYSWTYKAFSRKEEALDYTVDKSFERKISKSDWNHIQKLIYKHNFWTTNRIKVYEGVADGYAYFLEGRRPNAEQCNKKTDQIIGRVSPNEDDEIGILFDEITTYLLKNKN